MNVTLSDTIEVGWSPSVRLFEAAACGTPVISDSWPGLDEFFVPGDEIIIATDWKSAALPLNEEDDQARQIAARARQKALRSQSAAHRAAELARHLTAAAQSNDGKGFESAPVTTKTTEEEVRHA